MHIFSQWGITIRLHFFGCEVLTKSAEFWCQLRGSAWGSNRHKKNKTAGKKNMKHHNIKDFIALTMTRSVLGLVHHGSSVTDNNPLMMVTHSASSYLNLQLRLLSVTMNSCSWYKYSLLLSACNSCKNTRYKKKTSSAGVPAARRSPVTSVCSRLTFRKS